MELFSTLFLAGVAVFYVLLFHQKTELDLADQWYRQAVETWLVGDLGWDPIKARNAVTSFENTFQLRCWEQDLRWGTQGDRIVRSVDAAHPGWRKEIPA